MQDRAPAPAVGPYARRPGGWPSRVADAHTAPAGRASSHGTAAATDPTSTRIGWRPTGPASGPSASICRRLRRRRGAVAKKTAAACAPLLMSTCPICVPGCWFGPAAPTGLCYSLPNLTPTPMEFPYIVTVPVCGTTLFDRGARHPADPLAAGRQEAPAHRSIFHPLYEVSAVRQSPRSRAPPDKSVIAGAGAGAEAAPPPLPRSIAREHRPGASHGSIARDHRPGSSPHQLRSCAPSLARRPGCARLGIATKVFAIRTRCRYVLLTISTSLDGICRVYSPIAGFADQRKACNPFEHYAAERPPMLAAAAAFV